MLALQAGHVSVVALVAVLAGAGCAGSPARGPTSNQVPPSTVAGAPSVPTSDPATECAPPTQLSWTDVSLPDGTQFGWVRHFDGHALYLDLAEFFSDDEASARARLALLDDLEPSSWTTDSLVHVGTAAGFAETIGSWVAAGAVDGFHVRPSSLSTDLDVLVDRVVPLLQAAGLFRTGYPGRTLRDTLGLTRPANVFAATA